MSEFELIDKSKYESYAAYLDMMCEVSELTNPVGKVNCDGKQYLISRIVDDIQYNKQGYVLCHADEGELNLSGSFYEDKNFGCQTNNDLYMIGDNGTVVHQDLNHNFEQLLMLYETICSDPHMMYSYIQTNNVTHRRLGMSYELPKRNDYDQALLFLNNRYPNEVTYMHSIVPLARHMVNIENKFYKYIRLNNDMIMPIPFARPNNADELFDYYQSLGFDTSIPDNMIELYQGNNQCVKTLKKVTDIYRKNTNN